MNPDKSWELKMKLLTPYDLLCRMPFNDIDELQRYAYSNFQLVIDIDDELAGRIFNWDDECSNGFEEAINP